jgi:hypothetical protein
MTHDARFHDAGVDIGLRQVEMQQHVCSTVEVHVLLVPSTMTLGAVPTGGFSRPEAD